MQRRRAREGERDRERYNEKERVCGGRTVIRDERERERKRERGYQTRWSESLVQVAYPGCVSESLCPIKYPTRRSESIPEGAGNDREREKESGAEKEREGGREGQREV